MYNTDNQLIIDTKTVKLDDVSQNDIILRFGDEVFEPCPIELLINWAECDLDQTSEDLELDDTMEL